MLVHLTITGTGRAPSYISTLLRPVSALSDRSTIVRSATRSDLEVPRTRLKFGERAFSVAAAKVWNDLPLHAHTISNTDTFKRRLKFYLFCKFYDLAIPAILCRPSYFIVFYCIAFYCWTGQLRCKSSLSDIIIIRPIINYACLLRWRLRLNNSPGKHSGAVLEWWRHSQRGRHRGADVQRDGDSPTGSHVVSSIISRFQTGPSRSAHAWVQLTRLFVGPTADLS